MLLAACKMFAVLQCTAQRGNLCPDVSELQLRGPTLCRTVFGVALKGKEQQHTTHTHVACQSDAYCERTIYWPTVA